MKFQAIDPAKGFVHVHGLQINGKMKKFRIYRINYPSSHWKFTPLARDNEAILQDVCETVFHCIAGEQERQPVARKKEKTVYRGTHGAEDASGKGDATLAFTSETPIIVKRLCSTIPSSLSLRFSISMIPILTWSRLLFIPPVSLSAPKFSASPSFPTSLFRRRNWRSPWNRMSSFKVNSNTSVATETVEHEHQRPVDGARFECLAVELATVAGMQGRNCWTHWQAPASSIVFQLL